MIAFIASFLFVVLAEMGDKTQLLAMAFALKFRADKVIAGVFIATILNHALAVAAGRFLSSIVPWDLISLIAALSFIGFGLWTLRGDTLDKEAEKEYHLGPVMTVAIAFFIAEMGDKTQLATVSLAVKYNNPFAVLMGTTTGMLIADCVGIIVGVTLCKQIPERVITWISAIIFIIFGFIGTYQAIHSFFSIYVTGLVLGVVGVLTALAVWALVQKKPEELKPEICN